MRIYIPHSPGSGPDIVCRTVADRLQKIWGQPVVVENRVGVNGIIAMEVAKRAPPTGHEIVFVDSTPVASYPLLYKTLPYDVEADFVPLSLAFDATFFLVASSKTGASTAAELIQMAKANPGKLTYGSTGVGNPLHLAGAAFSTAAGISLLHVPFKDQGQMVNAIAAGDIDMMFLSAVSAAPAVKTGRAKLLAHGAKYRLHTHPDVPTIEEATGLGIEAGSWVGFLAPRSTPPEVVKKLNADIVAVLNMPDVIERIRAIGFTPRPSTPEQFAQAIRERRQLYAEVIRVHNIRLE